MTEVTYGGNSFYNTTPQITNYVSYLDFWKGKYVLPRATDSLIVLEDMYTHRPDLLAYALYDSTALFWIFMLRNPDVIKDPIWDFVGGIQIYVPTRDSVVGIA